MLLGAFAIPTCLAAIFVKTIIDGKRFDDEIVRKCWEGEKVDCVAAAEGRAGRELV